MRERGIVYEKKRHDKEKLSNCFYAWNYDFDGSRLFCF